MQCDLGTSYKSSMTTCPLETCESRSPKDDVCTSEPLVEGCAPEVCPEGQVYENARSYSCINSIECKVECLYFEGLQYYEGDVIEEGINYTW